MLRLGARLPNEVGQGLYSGLDSFFGAVTQLGRNRPACPVATKERIGGR